MIRSLNTDEIGLLLLIHRLQRTQRPLGRETLVPFAELKIPSVAREYEGLVGALREKTLVQGDPETFSLTAEGERMLAQVSEQHSLHAHFYNAYYQAVLHSRAHALFCERVYGKNLCQHGMADMEQLDILLDELEIESGMSLLDFGCGDGRISETISDETQTLVTGVDIAEQAIELALQRTQGKQERLCFTCADIGQDPTVFPAGSFDRIVAIDSLFFVRDQRAVLQALLGYLKPSGRMGIFYHCPGDVFAEQTVLGRALEELGIAYRVLDLSAQNARHWQRKKQVLLELEPMFTEEGSEFLFKNRIAECNGLEQFHRYLFIISN